MKKLGLISILAMFAASCGGPDTVSPSELIASLTESTESADLSFHFSPGDRVDVVWQQSFHEHVTDLLGVQPPRRLQYFKYTGRAQMQSLTGRQTNGWADPPQVTVHSIWRHDGHEVIHVYSALVGRPSDFFNEGIAVAMNVNPSQGEQFVPWGGEPVHDVARRLHDAGQLLRLSDYVTTSDFRELPESVTYPQAGSFVA